MTKSEPRPDKTPRPPVRPEEAAACVFEVIDVDGHAIPLRAALLEAREKTVGVLDVRDIVWVASQVTALTYARYAVEAGKPIRTPAGGMFAMGLAAIAGSVPEWFRVLGFDPCACVWAALHLMPASTRRSMEDIPSDLRQRLSAVPGVRPDAAVQEAARAYADFEEWAGQYWIEPVTDSSKRDALEWVYRRLHRQFAAPFQVSPEGARNLVARELRKNGGTHLVDELNAVDDAVSSWSIWEDKRRGRYGPRIPAYIGNKGRIYPDVKRLARAAKKAALSKGIWEQKRSESAVVANDPPLEQVADERTPMSDALRDEDENLLAEFRELLLADDLDSKMQENFRLTLKGVSRSERARRLKINESTLRKRERTLGSRIRRKAPARIRALIDETWGRRSPQQRAS